MKSGERQAPPRESMPSDREPYEAPQVMRVMLAPEEAVLGACKIGGTGGPLTSCDGGGLPCTEQGS